MILDGWLSSCHFHYPKKLCWTQSAQNSISACTIHAVATFCLILLALVAKEDKDSFLTCYVLQFQSWERLAEQLYLIWFQQHVISSATLVLAANLPNHCEGGVWSWLSALPLMCCPVQGDLKKMQESYATIEIMQDGSSCQAKGQEKSLSPKEACCWSKEAKAHGS